MTKQKPGFICQRCHKRVLFILDRICGSCADDLREERKADEQERLHDEGASK